MARSAKVAPWQFTMRTLLFATFAACVVLAAVRLYPGSVRGKLDQITPGMTEMQVLDILGRPLDKHAYLDDTVYWLYANGFHDPHVVEFDAKGRVLEVR